MPEPGHVPRGLAVGVRVARARLVDLLTSFDVSGNIWLSTMLVEALAACDAMEPMSTLDQLRAGIEAVLAEPDDPAAWTAASRIFYRRFEQEDIVGPYGEAIAELDDRRMLQLCVMAARAESSTWQMRRNRKGGSHS